MLELGKFAVGLLLVPVINFFGQKIFSYLLFPLGFFLLGIQSIIWRNFYGEILSRITPQLLGILGLGFYQVLYIYPVINFLKQREEWALMKGIIIATVMTGLLNICWLLFMYLGIIPFAYPLQIYDSMG